MNLLEIENLNQTGVYEIVNLINNKRYIGSTTQSFIKRLSHHMHVLSKNNHKNKHLQNAWNIYGKDNFKINILEVANTDILEKEQKYINLYDFTELYNINPLATNSTHMGEESLIQRRKTFTKTINLSMEYYFKLKEGLISEDDIPEKYRKLAVSRMKHIPWNKGLEMGETSYLKVPKVNFSEKYYIACKKRNEQKKSMLPFIEVYDLKGNFLACFSSVKDLSDLSGTDDFFLNPFMQLKNKVGRNNYHPYFLHSTNMGKVANSTNMSYKGLVFKYKHKTAPYNGDVIVELGELLESLK